MYTRTIYRSNESNEYAPDLASHGAALTGVSRKRAPLHRRRAAFSLQHRMRPAAKAGLPLHALRRNQTAVDLPSLQWRGVWGCRGCGPRP